MLASLSLKYRIAVVIFVLEIIMMATVLAVTLSSYIDSNESNLQKNAEVIVSILDDLG